MSGIDISTPKTILNTGVLQLQNGVAMSSTLTSVTDQSNTASSLQLSTTTANFTGNVGIGVTSPTQKLTIVGNNRILFTGVSPQNQTASFGTDSGDNAFINYGGGSGKSFTINGSGFDMWSSNSNQVLIADGSNGYLGVGIRGFSPNKVTIRGTGSTSATTSLLVQNSSAQTKFFVDDSSVGTGCSIGNLVNGYSSLQWNANNVGFGLISGGGLAAVVSNESFVIGTNTSPSGVASAMVVINSSNKGFLPPRMTDAQIRAIVAPAEGLIAYNTTISHLCCYQAGAWVKFSHSPM